MRKMIFAGFDTEQRARTGESLLRELHREGAVTLRHVALVVREHHGEVAVRERPGMRPIGTAGGLVAGGLVGLFGGPVAAAVGLGAGALAGVSIDLARRGVEEDFVKRVGAQLERGHAAVIAEVDEDSEGPLDRRMRAIGGTLLRQTREQIDDLYSERPVEPSREVLANLEAEQLADVRASQNEAARKETDRLQAKIDAARLKMWEKEDDLEARLQQVKEEGRKKIAVLEAQKAAASEQSQAVLEGRLADVRSDYEDRVRRSSEALDRRRIHAVNVATAPREGNARREGPPNS